MSYNREYRPRNRHGISANTPNWISVGCAAIYLLCFLFLPFYRVAVVGISGLALIQYDYPIMYLPLALAIIMTFASMLLPIKIRLGVGGFTFFATLLLLLFSRMVLLNGNALVALGNSAIMQTVGANVTTLIPVTAGVGCILSLIASATYIAAEIIMGSQKPKRRSRDQVDPLS